MADPQSYYSFAWCLEIIGPATIRRATTDLPEDTAVSVLGDFYKKGIKSIDARIVEALPSLFYGVRRRSGIQVVLSNADGDMDTTADWRNSPFTLWHYDRRLGVKREDLVGLVTDAQFANGQCVMHLDTVDTAILQELLPAATINPAPGSPFEHSGNGAGLPLPVIFGDDVLIQPPPIRGVADGDGEIATYDYALGFGANLGLSDAWAELDIGRPGLERLHNFVNAPGSPAYLTTELDPNRQATRFAVTGNQSVRFSVAMPIRFKTTTSGSAYRYSAVKSYVTSTTPHQVEIYDDLIDSGLNDVEISGDFAVLREVYATVTEGILPVPAEEQSITALRLFGAESSLTALLSNPAYPSGTGGTLPSVIIGDIIGNPVWGLSTRVQQVLDTATFDAVKVALAFAGLSGAVQGALGYDGKQVPSEQILDWLCMISRGARLGKNARGHWTIAVDAQTSSVASFVFGPGEESGTRIKRIVSYGRTPLDRAVRNLVLHWMPGGRARARLSALSPQSYARFSTKAVSGLGQDRHIYNPFIRDPDVAEKVLHYMAEMLKGADEQLVFTAGPEARDRTVGEVITAISTVDGFGGDWKIIELSKALADVQVSCIRNRDEAYDTPSGVTHSAEPTDDADTRTAPGVGNNLIGNPEPAPPTNRSGQYVAFTDPGSIVVVGVTPGSAVSCPNGWEVARAGDGGVIDELTMDESEAVRANTVSGHYVRMVWSAVSASAPSAAPNRADGMFADQAPIKSGRDYMFSFYGDADDGWAAVIYEYPHPTGPLVSTLVPLVRDDTDTDGNGWTRFYGRWRPKDVTTRAIAGVCVTKPGTYQFAGVMLNAINGSARKPSDWKRDTFSPPVLHRFSQEVELDGSTEYRVPLRQAGDYSVSATLRVTEEFTFGTATKWSVGTDNDPDVWAKDIRETFTVTTSANFKPGTVAAFVAEDSDVVVTFTKNDGTPGTATGGKFSIVYSYTRSFPTPGP